MINQMPTLLKFAALHAVELLACGSGSWKKLAFGSLRCLVSQYVPVEKAHLPLQAMWYESPQISQQESYRQDATRRQPTSRFAGHQTAWKSCLFVPAWQVFHSLLEVLVQAKLEGALC